MHPKPSIREPRKPIVRGDILETNITLQFGHPGFHGSNGRPTREMPLHNDIIQLPRSSFSMQDPCSLWNLLDSLSQYAYGPSCEFVILFVILQGAISQKLPQLEPAMQ